MYIVAILELLTFLALNTTVHYTLPATKNISSLFRLKKPLQMKKQTSEPSLNLN